jgi:hypothetical protein
MTHLPRLCLVVVLTAVAAALARHAAAATPYQGLYVVIDPYNQAQVANLKTASQTPCSQKQATTITPFCGAASGILLRLGWCNFQLYHLNNPQGQPYPGCHYVVDYTGAVGSPGVEVPSSDLTSPCAGLYDTCAGRVRGVLATALQYIGEIDTLRGTAGLAPLQLSVGMFAGIGTPQGVLDAVGYLDVPNYNPATDNLSTTQCYRLPLGWKPQFITEYEQALDQLIPYIQAQLPQGANITVLKAAALTATDLEIQMPGGPSTLAAPKDPGSGGPGPPLNCQLSAPGAQVWLNAYNANPIPSETFAQANEAAFGAVIGHEAGLLINAGLPNVLISIAETNGSAFASVNCGVSGSTQCSVTPLTMGNFSIYYLEKYVIDLFNGGLSDTQAQAAYAAIRSDTFSLAPTQISTNSTALSPTPIEPAQEITCALNNTIPARAPSVSLNNVMTPIYGVGSVIGFQTATEQGSLCAGGTYMTALNNGITPGSLFIEVEPDAAFTDLAQCGPSLSSALTRILQLSPPTTCAY